MAEQLALTLTDADQIDAFENATDAVAADVAAGEIDAEMWSGEIKRGEVVRILAEAYTGQIDFASPAKQLVADGGPRSTIGSDEAADEFLQRCDLREQTAVEEMIDNAAIAEEVNR